MATDRKFTTRRRAPRSWLASLDERARRGLGVALAFFGTALFCELLAWALLLAGWFE